MKNKIKHIIFREYLTRVKKKSFLIMTILGPILFASIMILPVIFATVSVEEKTVGVIDESGFFSETFKDSRNLKFSQLNSDIETAKKTLSSFKIDVILYIPKPKKKYPSEIFLYSEKSIGMNVESHIRNKLNDNIRKLKLKDAKIGEKFIKILESSVSVKSMKIQDDGSEKVDRSGINFIMGMVLGLLIYFFIFMYGVQVMKGVIEEKTNRIVEVIISSVKPIELMLGKIFGIALVGLTQFILWVVITLGILLGFQLSYSGELAQLSSEKMITTENMINTSLVENSDKNEGLEIYKAITSINFTYILVTFLFYFLFGYLVYATLFAAVGSAVDNETDTQQFILPLTIPLILSIIVSQFIANNPNDSLSFWFSIIPLTSPVSMMIRIPFEIPIWEMLLSMGLLVMAFIFFTWLAAKIYITGILMYGKKVTYKDIWKWIRC